MIKSGQKADSVGLTNDGVNLQIGKSPRLFEPNPYHILLNFVTKQGRDLCELYLKNWNQPSLGA